MDPNREWSLITLRGLKGVLVGIEDFPPHVEQLGLTRDQLKAQIETKLRKAGLRILTPQEHVETPGHPLLFLILNTGPSSNFPGAYGYSVTVELSQGVILMRDIAIKTVATTWQAASAGIARRESLPDLRKVVEARLDEFIRDFLAMNPPASN